jgi:hypothetical protein
MSEFKSTEPMNLTLKQAALKTGLSIYELRTGAKKGKYPSMLVGLGKGKLIFDMELLSECIKTLMKSQMAENKKGEENNVKH